MARCVQYFVGFPEGEPPIHFASHSEMARTSIMPDTFDGPMRLGLLRMGFDASHELSNLTIDGTPVGVGGGGGHL